MWRFHPAGFNQGTWFEVISSPSDIPRELTTNSGRCEFLVKDGLNISSFTTVLEKVRPSNPSSGTASGSACSSESDDECKLSVLEFPPHPWLTNESNPLSTLYTECRSRYLFVLEGNKNL